MSRWWLAASVPGPPFTRAFARLSYALVRDTGQPIPLKSVLFRVHQSRFSTVRLALASLTIDAPGTYTLRVDGLRPDVDYARCRILFTRDMRPRLVSIIVAIVLCAAGTIGMFVASILVATRS